MKKFIIPAALVLAAAVLFSGCASKDSANSGAASTHPREYTIDLAESTTGTTINIPFNTYGPNYQSDPACNFTNFIKKDKPQAGDVIHMYWKFSSNIDIPLVKISLIDPTVNYWLELAQDDFAVILDVKAGEIYEGSKDITLVNSVKGEFKAYITYDNEDFLKEGYAKVGAPAEFTLYDVEGVETTDVLKELPADAIATGPKTINININEIAAFCNIVTGHPWVNGVQIMSEIENYQADVSYQSLLEDAPEPGDTLVVTWRGRADRDIPVLKCMPVDHSASVGWWRIMINNPDDEDAIVIARDIKAGEVFEVSKTYVIDIGAESTDCNLRIWYDYDKETDGPGPCAVIAARD
ncbi:MAG: hypothetical protein MJ162_03690 [Treponema sp.]|nr:hypothetical protein [Treponema sp.]